MKIDEKLTHELYARNEEAFSKVYIEYYKLVFKVIKEKVHDQETSVELTQDTFMKMWNNISQFKIGTNFSAWLTTIAKNLANDYLRAHRKEWLSVILNNDLISSSGQLENSLKLEFQIDIKNILTEFEYQVVVLTNIYHLRRREVAEGLNKPLGTICRTYVEAMGKIENYAQNKNI